MNDAKLVGLLEGAGDSHADATHIDTVHAELLGKDVVQGFSRNVFHSVVGLAIDFTGAPKLTDFGIACKTDAPHLTQAGMLIGTPQYMSPEQCRGDEITPQSDIYSYGATMYHLLTGSPPFSWGETMRVLRSHINDEPVDIRTRNPHVDSALANLVMASLAKDPDDRPESMEAIARVLDPYNDTTNMHLEAITSSFMQSAVSAGGTAAIGVEPTAANTSLKDNQVGESTADLPRQKGPTGTMAVPGLTEEQLAPDKKGPTGTMAVPSLSEQYIVVPSEAPLLDPENNPDRDPHENHEGIDGRSGGEGHGTM